MTPTTNPNDRPPDTCPRRTAALLALALAAGPTACVLTRPEPTGLPLSITAPVAIPPGQALTVFQGGRLANASNRLDPWCELEVRTLAGAEPTIIRSGDFKVSRITSRLLLDPTTRIPALFAGTSCMDPLFQEGVWWLTSTEPSDAMHLRCIAPYYNCAFGPPVCPDCGVGAQDWSCARHRWTRPLRGTAPGAPWRSRLPLVRSQGAAARGDRPGWALHRPGYDHQRRCVRCR